MIIPPLTFAEQVSRLNKSVQDSIFTHAHIYYQSLSALPRDSVIQSLSDLFFPGVGLTFGQFAMGWLVFCQNRGATLQTFITPDACSQIYTRLSE